MKGQDISGHFYIKYFSLERKGGKIEKVACYQIFIDIFKFQIVISKCLTPKPTH
jgi:hypothetical protein